MGTLTMKGLWAHKRRLAGTFLAVFLGVAFLAGTLVLGDTLRANFDNLFAEANAGTDVVVRPESEIQTDPGEAQSGVIPESLVGELEAVDGVAAVAPSIEGYGEILGRDGDGLGGNGPPTIAGNWITDEELNPYQVAEGRPPRAGDEVVINKGAADDGDLKVGDTTTVLTPEPVEVEIVGIATFGSEDGLGGVTYAAFTLEAAQEYLINAPNEVSTISVRAESGVSQDELVQRIDRVLPADIEAISGSELTAENSEDINEEFLDVFTTFLVVFAGVALLVATFSIYNTFSILVAQRTRESALLRAVGAGQGQIVTSMIVEALLVGVLASGAGVLGGLGIAGLLKGLFDSFGFALPAGGLAVDATAVILPIVVGVVVTLAAGVFPAIKASRVPPLAALRDVALDRAGTSVVRAITGVAITALGVAVVLAAVLGGGDAMLPQAGLGALLTIIGVVVFGPVIAKSAAGLIGSPLPRLRGITGGLARQNAMRNPRRTASTASALMVGVGVVTLFTVFAASLKASIDESVSQSFRGDLVITTGSFGGGGLSPELTSDISDLPQVQTATGLGTGRALVDGDTEDLSVVEPVQVDRVLDLDVQDGSIARLSDQELAVSDDVADDNGWRVGTSVPVTFIDGANANFTVGAIFDASDIVSGYVMSRDAWAPHAVQNLDEAVLIELRNGVDIETGKTAVEAVAADFGAPDVQDRQEYVDSVAGNVDMMLGIVYVLLALAIIIALMGIANTLSLSIYERTRELGLLRAVGESRRQLRSMIRWESVIIAIFGTTGGLALGVFLGWALVQAASEGGELVTTTFAAPVGQLLIVLAVGALAGVLAGFRPARRAGQLDILRAIASE